MKIKTIKKLVLENILLLIPLLLYGIFKNGYLIYERGLINIIYVFKPLYLILISIVIKFIIDLILYRKIKIDYNLLCLCLVGMIMPYNINLIIYGVTLTIAYILSIFINKHFKFNSVCFIYLIIVLVNSIFYSFTYQNILEITFNYNFSYLDLLTGRNIGGISSTSVLFSLLIYAYLTFNIYYKKDIPLSINITYLILMFIYFGITKDSSYLLNSELIFGSVFVATLPISSPFKSIHQIFYGIFIGILSFIISLLFNSVISIYIAIFIASLVINIKVKKLLNTK